MEHRSVAGRTVSAAWGVLGYLVGGEFLQKGNFIHYPVTIIIISLCERSKSHVFPPCCCWIVEFLTQMPLSSFGRGALKDSYLMLWEWVSLCQVPGWSLAVLVCLTGNPLALIMVLVAQTQSEKILFPPQQAGMVCKFVLAIQNL